MLTQNDGTLNFAPPREIRSEGALNAESCLYLKTFIMSRFSACILTKPIIDIKQNNPSAISIKKKNLIYPKSIWCLAPLP